MTGSWTDLEVARQRREDLLREARTWPRKPAGTRRERGDEKHTSLLRRILRSLRSEKWSTMA